MYRSKTSMLQDKQRDRPCVAENIAGVIRPPPTLSSKTNAEPVCDRGDQSTDNDAGAGYLALIAFVRKQFKQNTLKSHKLECNHLNSDIIYINRTIFIKKTLT